MQQWIFNFCSGPPSLGGVRCSPGDMDQPESSVWRSRSTEVMERTQDAGVWQLLSFLSQGFSPHLSETRLQLGRFQVCVLTSDFHYSL